MKVPAPADRRLRRAALVACKQLTGIDFRVAAGGGPDAEGATVVDAVPAQGQPVRFRIIDRPTLRPEAVGGLVELGRRGRHPLLVAAPYVDFETAEKARELGLAFVDTAGNAHLRGPRLLIFIAGRRPPARPRPPRAPRALTPAGLRVVFTLLLRPERAAAPLREIADETGVALGTAAATMADLVARGHLTPPGAGETRLLDTQRLAEEWTLLYPVRLRPKLARGRYTAPDRNWWHKAVIAPRHAAFGGEIAADLLTGYLKPGRVTLYVWGKPDDIIVANRLRPDERGEVEILDAFWTPPEAAQATAPALLVYADLMATGDPRNLEAGRLVRERYLRGVLDPA